MPDQPEQIPCGAGCCASFAEHVRTIRVASPGRRSMIRETTDDHGTHSVVVTEHYHDRQDVLVKSPQTVRLTRE